jgi:hypothetical protein
VRLFGVLVATTLLAFGALNLWVDGNDDLCSGQDTIRCDDAVVRIAGVALWVLLAALVVLTALAVLRLGRWARRQRRFRRSG